MLAKSSRTGGTRKHTRRTTHKSNPSVGKMKHGTHFKLRANRRKHKTRRRLTRGGNGTPHQFLNVVTPSTSKINCTNISERDIKSNFLLQLHNPASRRIKSAIVDDCSTAGSSGSYNTTCVAKLNSHVCINSDKKVLVRTSKTAVAREDMMEMTKSVENALFMSEYKLGPKIYDVQYTSDGKVSYIMELFDMDLHGYIEYLNTQPIDDLAQKIHEALVTQTQYILKTMIKYDLSCIDIKPGNAVIKVVNKIPVLRFIDVDADYCKEINQMVGPIKKSLSMLNYNKEDRNEFMYKYLMVLFANHLHGQNHNYLFQVIRQLVDEKDQVVMLHLIRNNPEISRVARHYFRLNPDSYNDMFSNAKYFAFDIPELDQTRPRGRV
jgi:hypothetical protein